MKVHTFDVQVNTPADHFVFLCEVIDIQKLEEEIVIDQMRANIQVGK